MSMIQFLKNYISGLKIKPNETNPLYQIDIETGQCRCKDDNCNLVSNSPITIDLTVSGANGLDIGSEVISSWYHAWLIYKQATNSCAGLFSLSDTSPVMPAGYGHERRIGAVRNDSSSNFLDFYMLGNSNIRRIVYPLFGAVLNGGTATSFTNVDCSAFVPPTSRNVLLGVSGFNFTPAPFTVQLREDNANYLRIVRGYNVGDAEIFLKTSPSQIIEYKVQAFPELASINVLEYMEEL